MTSFREDCAKYTYNLASCFLSHLLSPAFRVKTPVRWAWLLRNRRIENQGEKSDDAERSNAEVEDRLTVIREIKAKFKQN